ncbi:MAG TPA: murein transglycosylase domain-containing protein [Elusimicrobiota bacterium]|nr:murein transglycosylase domain-containing protein [Elusimicrobiota bacterium]
MKSRVLLAACALLALAAPALPAQKAEDAAFDELDQEKKASDADPGRDMYRDLDRLSKEMTAQYQELARNMEAQRAELRAKVLRQWSDVRESTRKEWVDYAKDAGSRSAVDFEKGQIQVEVLVPVSEAASGRGMSAAFSELDAAAQGRVRALAEKKIAVQTRKILAEKEGKQPEVLKDQVRAADGKAVTAKTADAFVKRELAPKMVVDEKPVVAQDGTPRIKVTVAIPMAPDHLRVRAERYKPQVDVQAKKYGLDPALLYAVIHTESYFNPMARSHSGALGLMQLVPSSAGHEAYKYLYKEDKLVTPDYLYNPDNNILLGATYLHMLQTQNFPKVKNADNQRTLCIAAYNCGPGCVRKSVLSRADADTLKNEDLVAVIRKFAPKETQDYVPAVQGRMALYQGL